MITASNISEIKSFAKGEIYTLNVEDYNDAMNQAVSTQARLEEQFKKENPYICTFLMPFTERKRIAGKRVYCIEVWMEYTDMTASKDVRVRFFFKKNWFAAARKAVAKRQQLRKEQESIFSLFGL